MAQLKRCRTCDDVLTLDSFGTHRRGKHGVRGSCKSCEWEKERDRHFRRKFGITAGDYDMMCEEQKGCCAICGKHESEFTRRHAVDHCHTTGRVRGLLCTKCNNGLGCYDDDIARLKNAIKYLEEK